MKRGNRLMAGIACLWIAATASAGVPESIGSMMGKGVALYAEHTNAVIVENTKKTQTIDYKLVTLDSQTYAYVKVSNGFVGGADWSLHVRCYDKDGKGSAEKTLPNNCGTYRTGVFGNSTYDPLQITLWADVDGRCESDFISYDITKHNSIVAGNEAVPATITATVSPADGGKAELKITSDESDADLFYYVEDETNGYKTIAFTKETTITGLPENYTLKVTPVNMLSGKSGVVVIATVKEDLFEFVPTAETTYTGWDAGAISVTFPTDSEKGTVCYVETAGGSMWAGIRFLSMPEGLGANGAKYTYAHLIAKCTVNGQNVWRLFGHQEEGMINDFVPADQWQDIIFKVANDGTKQPITEISLQLDRRDGISSRSLYIQKIVFSNSAAPLIEPAKDTEKPTLTSATVVDNSITYNSIALTVEATDNIGVNGYVVTDAANGYSKEIAAPTNGNQITVKGLAPSTTYTLRVQAKDLAGNLSEAITLAPFTTLDRKGEPSGTLTEKGGDAEWNINYSVTYNKGKLTYKIEAPQGKTLTFGEMHVMNINGGYGFTGMVKQDDGSYTLTPEFVYPKNMPVYAMFVWNMEGHAGNLTSANNDDYDNYVFFRPIECVENPLSDDVVYAATADASQVSALYTRTFAQSGSYSICLPFRAEIPVGITVKEYKGGADGIVQFAEIEGTEMAAHTPYVLEVATAGEYEFWGIAEADGKVIVKAASSVKTEKGTSSQYQFVGNYEKKEGVSDVYFLHNDGSGFIKTKNASIGSFRAYIEVLPGVDGAPKLVIGNDGGGATNIEAANTDELTIYSESGMLNVVSPAGQMVKVFGIDGRLVRTLELHEGENVVTDLAKGIYVIANQKVVLY